MPKQQQYFVEVFVQNRSLNKVSCGKYKTLIENYVLCVDVEKLDLTDLLTIQIEFSGKAPD